MRTTEERLSEAHARAARAVGELSLMLQTRRLSKTKLLACRQMLGSALAELEPLLTPNQMEYGGRDNSPR